MSAAAKTPQELHLVLGHLQGLPLFSLPDPEALADLAAVCQMQRTRAGEVVLEEASEGDTMLVIVSGRVRVEKKTLHQDSYTVSFLETGNFFGELAMLDRDRRSATCVAETDCDFLVIHRDDFIAFGDRHHAAGLTLTRRIASRLADRLLTANDEIVTLFTALVQEVEGGLR